jgi:acyl-CoA reductase-like NAD-dependent aldehyde dehydrogenase
VVPIVYWSKLEEVVRFVRTLPTGKPLGLYCFGTDAAFIECMKERTTSGGLCINDAIMQISVHGASGLPFGGVGNSGTGTPFKFMFV